MSNACCPDCRLRLGAPEAAYLSACPQCGRPVVLMSDLAGIVGFRRFVPEPSPEPLPTAIAVSLPVPDPNRSS